MGVDIDRTEVKNYLQRRVARSSYWYVCQFCHGDLHEQEFEAHHCRGYLDHLRNVFNGKVKRMQNLNHKSNIVPVLAKQLSTDHIVRAFVADKDRRINLDGNFFKLLAERNPLLQASDFLDFIQKCQLSGADPRRNQIYLITRNQNVKEDDGQWRQKVVGTTVFAYQFFIQRAQSTGLLSGFTVDTEMTTYCNPITGRTRPSIVSICTVWRKDREKPTVYRARFDEFVPKDKNGAMAPNRVWREKPYLMLEKTALCNGLRQAFPEDLQGMYISEEMTGDESREVLDIINADDMKQPILVDEGSIVEKQTEVLSLLKSLFEDCGKEAVDQVYKEFGINGRIEVRNQTNRQTLNHWIEKLRRINEENTEGSHGQKALTQKG